MTEEGVEAQAALLTRIMQVYGKLRQTHKFVDAVLRSLDGLQHDEVTWPAQFLSSMSLYFSSLPLSSFTSIWQSLVSGILNLNGKCK